MDLTLNCNKFRDLASIVFRIPSIRMKVSLFPLKHSYHCYTVHSYVCILYLRCSENKSDNQFLSDMIDTTVFLHFYGLAG